MADFEVQVCDLFAIVGTLKAKPKIKLITQDSVLWVHSNLICKLETVLYLVMMT